MSYRVMSYRDMSYRDMSYRDMSLVRIPFLPQTYKMSRQLYDQKHKEIALNDHNRSATLSVFKRNEMDPMGC